MRVQGCWPAGLWQGRRVCRGHSLRLERPERMRNFSWLSFWSKMIFAPGRCGSKDSSSVALRSVGCTEAPGNYKPPILKKKTGMMCKMSIKTERDHLQTKAHVVIMCFS